MEQVSGYARRFQLSRAVSSQAGEFYRLAEVRGILAMRSVSASCLALVCLEIASEQHGEPFDKKQAQKLSGLQARAYASTLHSVGSVLNLSSTVTLRELAVRFGCLEAQQIATETLHNYREKMESTYTEAQNESMDLTKPLYIASSLYTACKLLKIRSDKTRFQSAANCPSKAVFQTVLDQMSDCVPKTTGEKGEKRRKRKRKDTADKEEDCELSDQDEGGVASSAQAHTTQSRTGKSRRESLRSRAVSSPLSPDYLQWKERTLATAREKLASQE